MSRTIVLSLAVALASPAALALAAPKAADVRPPVAADLATYTKSVPGHGDLTATIDTSLGTIHCTLFEADTPITVASFVGLATGQKAWLDPKTHKPVGGKHFYDGLTFHRVIPQFMIQGGDPAGDGTGGPGYEFANEISPNLKFQIGSLAMANAGPATDGSQFFITESAPAYLQGGYTIFGQCGDQDVVKAIARVPKGASQETPATPVIIKKVTITREAAKPAPAATTPAGTGATDLK